MELINTYVGKLFGLDLGYQEEWRTDIVTFDTPGIEQRNQIYPRPIRHWTLPYSRLQKAYRDKLLELFSRGHGKYNTFTFEDPYDYSCALTECSITAIAAQVLFQLVKSYYPTKTETWTENKIRIQPGAVFSPVVKVDGVTKTEGADYTLDDNTGIVTFSVAPGVGKIITANYQFYYKVRFDIDAYEESGIVKNLFETKGLPIIEVA